MPELDGSFKHMILLKLLMQLFEEFTFGHRHLATVLLDTFAADSEQFEGDAMQRFLKQELKFSCNNDERRRSPSN